MDGDAGGGLGDVGVADAAGDVEAVEVNAVAFALGLEGDFGVRGQGEEGGFFVEVEVALDGFEGEGAVHGPGFEVEEAEFSGEVGGEGALACSGRAVDGDYRAFALLGVGHRAVLLVVWSEGQQILRFAAR